MTTALFTNEQGANRLPSRHWTRDEYYHAAEVGLLRHDERLELLEGEIVVMSPKGPRHVAATRRTMRALTRAFAEVSCVIRKEDPIVLADTTEPEPDVVVARGSDEDYDERHPDAEDILLIVEVSDLTLRADREQKGRIYAQAGIPDYWIVNVPERRIEVRRTPVKGSDGAWSYETTTLHQEGDTFAPLAAPEAVVAVNDLLP